MSRDLQQFALDCGGVLVGDNRAYSAVSTDSRSITRDELFIALRGEKFDGNAYLEQVAARSAAGALAEREGPAGFPVILVEDTLLALQRAARSHRQRFSLPLIAVAGSNGKTTCKEMLGAILGEAGATLVTRGNLNNHIGVPLTLLRLAGDHRQAVIELGANHPGEVALLASLAVPTIGIVTNAGAEHLEGFGSIEGAARAEGELFAALAPEAVAVINVDDPYAAMWREMTVAKVVSFGLGTRADFTARDIHTEVGETGFLTRFELQTPVGDVAIALHLAGKHNVLNALGAAAAAMAAGATLAQVATGLGRMRAVAGRLHLRPGAAGQWIIDDSYNANPSSMQAAIEVLGALAGERWFVMGDMGELGAYAPAAHAEIGHGARVAGIDRLFATGPLSKLAVDSFGAGASWHVDVAALIDALQAALATAKPAAVRILVKGSRMNRLERVVDALAPSATAGALH